MMRRAALLLLAAAACIAPTLGHAESPAISLSLAGVSGGDTNDFQISYGAGLELLRSSRLSASLETLYVRDFFELEPDTPLADAATYSDVLSLAATGRFQLRRATSGPYLLGGPAWLRSRALGRNSHQAGFQVGAGWLMPSRSRLRLRVEARRFGSLSGDGDTAPGKRYSFWRYGLEVGWLLGRNRAQP